MVNIEGLRQLLWAENCRPCVRTIREWTANGMIPYMKLGSRVFFNPQAVMDAIEKKRTVRVR